MYFNLKLKVEYDKECQDRFKKSQIYNLMIKRDLYLKVEKLYQSLRRNKQNRYQFKIVNKNNNNSSMKVIIN